MHFVMTKIKKGGRRMKIKVKNIISKIAAVGVMILMVFSAMPNVAFAADSATALETVKALGITTGENLSLIHICSREFP